MSYKKFDLDGLGEIKIYKRRGNRVMRLSIAATGEIRLSIPWWVSYEAGLTFAKSRQRWLSSHRQTNSSLIHDGQIIGKEHRVMFLPVSTSGTSTRIKDKNIIISHPKGLPATHLDIQAAASKASIRALRREAEELLPHRLQQLASQHGYRYNSVIIKKLKSRWGSCDQNKDIVLNLFLMQLPWDLIDYVLLHELTHTKVMRHGPPFWQEVGRILPNVGDLRKQIRAYRPALGSFE